MRGKFRLDGRRHLLNSDGHPLIIYLTNKNDTKKELVIDAGYRCKKPHWDQGNQLPTKKHPDYANLINYLSKKKLALLRLLDMAKQEPLTLDYAKSFLLGEDSDIFYDAAYRFVAHDRDVRRSALDSFDSIYPKYAFRQITPKVAETYMEKLIALPLKSGRERSLNGVHTYMRTLTTLWNRSSNLPNPFKGVRPKTVKAPRRILPLDDLVRIRDIHYIKHVSDGRNISSEAVNLNRYYFLLLFYLGGINMKVLANLRYDRHIVNDRVEFYRDKGGSSVFCNNRIFPEAREIMERIQSLTNCYPYVVPVYRYRKHNDFVSNFNDRFGRQCAEVEVTGFKDSDRKFGLSRKPTTYSARFTFINRAKQLGIDERICMEIVGHSQNKVHSIYPEEFSLKVRDRAHKKIIRF